MSGYHAMSIFIDGQAHVVPVGGAFLYRGWWCQVIQRMDLCTGTAVDQHCWYQQLPGFLLAVNVSEPNNPPTCWVNLLNNLLVRKVLLGYPQQVMPAENGSVANWGLRKSEKRALGRDQLDPGAAPGWEAIGAANPYERQLLWVRSWHQPSVSQHLW